MDQRDAIISKVRTYSKLVESGFPLKIDQCWLFGSFAKGGFNENSDIDVALVVNSLGANYNIFETEPILWKLTEDID
jgi:predicted nucleotidyltransferase